MAGPTTFWGPVHRLLARVPPGSLGFPPNAAPGLEFLGAGIQDHRLPYNLYNSESGSGIGALGWYGVGSPMVANYVPSAVATANIAALANVANGVAMTLVNAAAAGITPVTAAAPALIFPGLPGVPTGLVSGVAIDGIPTYHRFGSGGSFVTGFYNRGTCVGRGVSITGVVGGAGGAFLVKGYDAYGYAMSQLMTVAAGANTVNSTKTFKIISSVTPQFTDAHNYSVGTADIYGFGLLSSYWGDVDVVWNNTSITASAGYTAADTTSPATTTTGDVRGTYATQSTSDGTKRLMMYVTPTIGAIITNPTTGLFGQPQV